MTEAGYARLIIDKKDEEIEKLEQDYKTLEGCLLVEQEYTLMLEKQIEKMKCCINDLVHLGEFNENTDEEYLNYQVHEALKQAEQFIKEIEK